MLIITVTNEVHINVKYYTNVSYRKCDRPLQYFCAQDGCSHLTNDDCTKATTLQEKLMMHNGVEINTPTFYVF